MAETMKQKVKRLAETVYELPERAQAFEVAYARWPKHNEGGADTDEAAGYIVQQLIFAATVIHGTTVTEKVEAGLREELGEMVYAGLT